MLSGEVLQTWWAGLQHRERWILLGGAGVLGLVLLYVLLWEPLLGRLRVLRTEVQNLREEVSWMRGAAAQVRALEGNQSSLGTVSRQGQSLLTLVDQSARSAGLGEALQRVEPQQDDSLRVQFEAVSFDQLVLWLGELGSRYQVAIVNVVIDRETNGRVNARLVLQDQRS